MSISANGFISGPNGEMTGFFGQWTNQHLTGLKKHFGKPVFTL